MAMIFVFTNYTDTHTLLKRNTITAGELDSGIECIKASEIYFTDDKNITNDINFKQPTSTTYLINLVSMTTSAMPYIIVVYHDKGLQFQQFIFIIVMIFHTPYRFLFSTVFLVAVTRFSKNIIYGFKRI